MTEIAAHKFTVSRYVGYGLPDRQVEVTLGQMLGADHIEWICAQPYPAGTAGCRARGQWDCNNLEMCAAYTELERVLCRGLRPRRSVCLSPAILAARLIIKGDVALARAEVASFRTAGFTVAESRALIGACREANRRYGCDLNFTSFLA